VGDERKRPTKMTESYWRKRHTPSTAVAAAAADDDDDDDDDDDNNEDAFETSCLVY
jgi:hypothetical protein